MITLNNIELEMREACRLALNYLTRKQVERREYVALMAALRDAVRRADLKEFGCPTGTHTSDCTCDPRRVGSSPRTVKYRTREKGYTLIELMIVVAMMAVMAAVCIPIMGTAIARAKDATTLGNLATLRAALAMYYCNTEGTYPRFPPPLDQPAGYGTLLGDALVPLYLTAIPQAIPSGGHHKASNDVGLFWNQTGNEDDMPNGGWGWKYDANPYDVGVFAGVPGYGSIMVLCTHQNSKGINWSTY